MIKKKVTVTKIRFPTGREEEIYGTDYTSMALMKKAFQCGALVVERRKDLYHCKESEFVNAAKYMDTIEREVMI